MAAAFSGCGSTAATTAAHAKAEGSKASRRLVRVLISGYAFHPGAVSVVSGSRISFTNRDKTEHTATASGGAFDTGSLAPGQTRSVVLRRPGTYTYYCQFHAFMRATIRVR
jgi:plastocyanin